MFVSLSSRKTYYTISIPQPQTLHQMEIISEIQLRGVAVENDRDDSTDILEIRETYVLKENLRGEPLSVHTIPLTEDDILEFQFDDDTVWISDPGSMDELFPDAVASLRNRGDAVFHLPSTISTTTGERGPLLKKIVLKVFKVFTKKKVVGPLVHQLAGSLEEKMLNPLRGVLHVDREFNLTKTQIQESALHLLLIHGTAASTLKTFGDIRLVEKDKPEETAIWKHIFTQYQQNVLAFEHESLTKSPLTNVLELVQELPKNIRLHLLTQSRGGLVGDILSRFCIENSGGKGFSEIEKKYLRDHGRSEDADLIEKIQTAISVKNISIEKYIRVACPANGTTLASKRLDIWLNVIFNVAGVALGQSTNPIYIAFKNLLTAVVESKDDPNVLPGMAPQNPEFPFNKVLNNSQPDAEIKAPLLIIAGDNQLSFKWKALLGILTNLFFLGKNDFIVNTRSMYQGARRAKGSAQFFLDESPEVSHFNYFANSSTRDAILVALQSVGTSRIPGFSLVQESELQQSLIRGIELTISKGEIRPNLAVSGKKPIVVLLPGIMGSNLYVGKNLVWVDFVGFFKGDLTQLKHDAVNNKNINALSVVGDSYGKLHRHLSADYDVTVFPFDWRLPMKANTAAFNDWINELLVHKQPIKLVAHSMGGVLVRDFMLDHSTTWKKINDQSGFSLVLLGAPLAGSFRIASVLFGQDSLIKKLSLIDPKNSKKELLGFFSQFPGILGLLPLTTDAANDFANKGTWQKMREAFGDNEWPIPEDNLLSEFKQYRDHVIANANSLDFSKAVYIAGLSDGKTGTISGYQIVPRSFFFRERLKLEFLATLEGDGSVTWDSGIPKKMISTDTVYYSDVEHGELANDESLFSAISEILKSGSTQKLSKKRPTVVRGAEKEFKALESFDFDTSEAGLKNAVLGLRAPDSMPKFTELPIRVSVTHGDLKYATYPLLIGHFENDGIMSAEKAVDQHLNGELSRRLQLGIYPGEVGTNMQVFSPENSGFKGIIVLGLGKQGELNDRYVIKTTEQGVSSYLIGLINNASGEDQKPGISALIIGSGYGGLGIERCVRAILQGVQNANQKIRQAYGQKALRIHALEFIELYQDNTLSCMRSLKLLENEERSGLSILRGSTGIKELMGRKIRIPMESSREWWTRITVRQYVDSDNVSDNIKSGLRFAISTDAARIEERTLHTTGDEILNLLETSSVSNQWSPKLAKTLFELLIPNDFKAQVKRLNNIIWQLDSFTASFPWELLLDTIVDGIPLSVNSGMIRQLATPNFRILVNSVNTPTVLVVADPNLEDPQMQLPAAREEGDKISKRLSDNGYGVTSDIGGSVDSIFVNLYSQNYKVMHLAGHGVFEFGPQKQTGMLIGPNIFLTPAHIDQMSSVPELVFVNCCFLGETNALSEELTQNRHQLAANIGTQLIQIGVKAVIVAGWAVNDNAALSFAENFYQAMLEGKLFGEAVKKARKAIFEGPENRSNTWGAYQCYGDPFYRLLAIEGNAPYRFDFEVPAVAEMELTNLLNELDSGTDANSVLPKLNAINVALRKDNLQTAKITELLAAIYSALGMYKEAIDQYKLLGTLPKATFSLRALEQYCNIRVKYYSQLAKSGDKTASDAADEIEKVTEEIQRLISFGETDERLNILGSAFKRLGMLSTGDKKTDAYQSALEAYRKAYGLADPKEKYYPLTNWVAIDHAIFSKVKKKAGTKASPEEGAGVEKNQDQTAIFKTLLFEERDARLLLADEKRSFWDWVAQADIEFCLMLLKDSKIKFKQVLESYQRAWKQAGHQGNRIGILEHLDILTDLYGISAEGEDILKPVADLRKNLEELI